MSLNLCTLTHPCPVKLQIPEYTFSSLIHNPHISIALDSVNFQPHFCFGQNYQYKPCSKCYEKMYMFIQGRLWQDTRGSPTWSGPRRYLLSPPPYNLGTSSALPPSECAHHPYSLGKQLVDLCHFPTPGEKARISQALSPCNCSPLWAKPKGHCSVQR